MNKYANKVITLIRKKDAVKMTAAAGAGGLAVGGVAGYHKGKKDGKKSMKKKASVNVYLEKIARSIGDIGKGIIRTKLAPVMKKMTPARASNIEAISRASAGSKVAPKVFSTPEYAQHAKTMSNLAPRLAPGMRAPEANRIMAVAARARRMGVL